MKVEVFKCDGCGKLIESGTRAFRMKLEGDEWYTGPGNSDYSQHVYDLHFCDGCARGIKRSLELISERGQV